MMRIGIDASNLRSGGTMTHIAELLAHAEPARHGITRVTVWASAVVLERLPLRPWLNRVHVRALDATLPQRVAWQLFERSRMARGTCDVVFAPGATPAGDFRPYVSMSANMLPFAPHEHSRYGWSGDRLRLALLRRQQARAFSDSSAVIFLTDHARTHISTASGLGRDVRVEVIPSGVNDRFRCAPRPALPLSSYSKTNPFRFLDVSDVHPYKHHWNVAHAVARMYRDGLPVALDIIGFPIHAASTEHLEATLTRLNGDGAAVRFLGPLSHDALPPIYCDADAFIFASTCENLPMTLIEAMAAGLPIAASSIRPMSDILGDALVGFDPESIPSIESALRRIAEEHSLRARVAQSVYDAALRYSWDECSDRTFALLAEVARAARRVDSSELTKSDSARETSPTTTSGN